MGTCICVFRLTVSMCYYIIQWRLLLIVWIRLCLGLVLSGWMVHFPGSLMVTIRNLVYKKDIELLSHFSITRDGAIFTFQFPSMISIWFRYFIHYFPKFILILGFIYLFAVFNKFGSKLALIGINEVDNKSRLSQINFFTIFYV